MIREAQPEMIQALDEAISEKIHPLISEELLEIEAFKIEMQSRGVELLKGKGFAAALTRHDFEFLGRVKISGNNHMFYSKRPELFRSLNANEQVFVDFAKIRKIAEQALRNSDPLASPADDPDEL
jgi:hypothetical protein